MSERAASRAGAAGRAPVADHPEHLRNVVLVGVSGSGKTTLTESLALAAGALTRAGRVDEGSTVSDHEEIEHQQQRSVRLSLVPVEWQGVKINLLDPPGHADFAGELRAALRAADAAVFVVSATDPVTGPVRALWQECALLGLPRAIAVTHMDAARADFDAVLAACREALGDGRPDSVQPVDLPVRSEGRLRGTVELLSGETHGQSEPAPPTGPAREQLVEAIAGEDDELLERYVGGEPLAAGALARGLRGAVLHDAIHPLLPLGEDGTGAVDLLDLIVSAFPAPTDRPLPEPLDAGAAKADPAGPLVAQVIQNTGDPYVGRLSLVRVFSGTVHPDLLVHLAGRSAGPAATEEVAGDGTAEERIAGLTSPFGKQQRPVPHAVAGDLVCVSKLTAARVGDTLSDPAAPVVLTPWELPEPLLPIAVKAHSRSDEDKLSQGLARLAAQDPTVRVEQNPATGQLVLWCTGEAHIGVLLHQLGEQFGVQVEQVPYQVALRETFGAAATGHGRLVKQSGGHGQYAICELLVEPLPGGTGFEFVDQVVGGAVPRHFIPSVEKGVRAQLAHGVGDGYPLVDVRVTLVDGKAHSVDSSDSAFQSAAALALRDAAAQTTVRLLEPVAEVGVLVPDEYLGGVFSDLSVRRARVLGTEAAGAGRSLLRAEVPELELTRYAVDLRSLTHGTGSFTRTPLRYEPMPGALAEKVAKPTD
ncbi:elongation factor G-like protein EF-G2 [Kitasatospora sp. NBC_01250]|uniref:elongation factor G-like protein EF-G2 n=1 Tax=unclassified Kitasatospora TaxID=2633591 RepID=UPI002E16765D|nr:MULTISPECIES: elongation factor G-like protein EF-G2 [unclassified Kitasatospora]WSJ65855.1 elongation factor G-like protein EF-G2 [Kitasatospora sp. NBC_01302]